MYGFPQRSNARRETLLFHSVTGGGSRGIVTCPAAGHVNQRVCRSEALAVLVLQLLQHIDHAAGAEIIDHPQGPSTEWRESDSVHRAEVAVARAPDHLVRAGGCRLIQHEVDQPPLDSPGGNTVGRSYPEEGIHRVIDSRFVAVVIPVEATPVLAAESGGTQQPVDCIAR